MKLYCWAGCSVGCCPVVGRFSGHRSHLHLVLPRAEPTNPRLHRGELCLLPAPMAKQTPTGSRSFVIPKLHSLTTSQSHQPVLPFAGSQGADRAMPFDPSRSGNAGNSTAGPIYFWKWTVPPFQHCLQWYIQSISAYTLHMQLSPKLGRPYSELIGMRWEMCQM